MTSNVICIRLEQGSAVQGLRTEALAVIQADSPDLELDLGDILQIDIGVVRALEELADAADQRHIRVRLRNANVSVYKTLLLLGLVRRFTFAN